MWGDIPADRHAQGGVVSYADGHAEQHHWRWPKRNRPGFPTFDKVRNAADLVDYKFMWLGQPRGIDYTPAWWGSIQ
jgi:prepilin-type processing-associated H-X9-DG protein